MHYCFWILFRKLYRGMTPKRGGGDEQPDLKLFSVMQPFLENFGKKLVGKNAIKVDF